MAKKMTPEEIKQMYSVYRQWAVRRDEHREDLGPRGSMPSLEETAAVAMKEGRYQDAVEAYSLDLCYSFTAEILSSRAEAYLKLGNFRYAYIDANEAVKLHKAVKDRQAEALPPPKLAEALYRRAMALDGLGYYQAARLSLAMCRRTWPDPAYGMQIDVAEETLEGKKDLPSATPEFLTKYDPLESDSPEFSRERFIGAVNRFILNGWSKPNKHEKRFRFDFATWKSINETKNSTLSRTRAAELLGPFGRDATVDAHVIGLCYGNEYWLSRAGAFVDSDPQFAYINAAEGYKSALRTSHYIMTSKGSLATALALYTAGFHQKARKAIEPALRLGGEHMPKVNELHTFLLHKTKDEAKMSEDALEKTENLCGEGYCSELMRSIRPALTEAVEKIYGKDVVDNVAFNDGNHDDLPMLCDENSTPDQIVDVANDGARALNAGRYSEARRLLTMAHIACGRQDPTFLYNRAHAYLADGRRVEAYIDACESIKLEPTRGGRAYEVKALALSRMGHVAQARKTLKTLRNKCPSYAVQPSTLAELKVQKETPMYPMEFLDNYNPTFTDDFGLGSLTILSEVERRSLQDVKDLEEAKKRVASEDYNAAIALLDKPTETMKLPFALTLRAESYFRLKEGGTSKAYTDVADALKMDKFFHDAILLKGRILLELGLFAKARKSLKDFIKLASDTSEAKRLLKSIEGKQDDPKVSPNEIDLIEAAAEEEPGPEYDSDMSSSVLRRIFNDMCRFTSDMERKFGKKSKQSGSRPMELYERFNDVLRTMVGWHDGWEEEKKRYDSELKATRDLIRLREFELEHHHKQLRALNDAHHRSRDEIAAMQERPHEAENATTTENEKRLEKTLIEKEQELAHARQVYEALQQQNHALKEEAERVKEERKSWKSHVKSTDELQQELEKARQECAKRATRCYRPMLTTEEECKRKDMENRDIIRRLQRNNVEYDAKIRKLEERKERLAKQLTDKSVENSGLLAQLLDAIEALKTEEERHANSLQNDSGTTKNSVEAARREAMADPDQLEAFKNAVYSTLTGSVDGYSDMRTLLAHLRIDTGADGETNAREFGFESLEAFLRSPTMKDKVFVKDGEDRTVYLARPNATNRHNQQAWVEGAELAAGRRNRRASFDARDRMQSAVDDERNRANALAEELNETREELRCQRRDAAELEKEARCQICMVGRPNQTTFVVRNDAGEESACGHVSCDICAQTLATCPRCPGRRIISRIRIYL